MTKIFALTTIYEGIELLPHFLRHYTRLGVDEILVAVGIRQNTDFVLSDPVSGNIAPAAIRICHDFPTRVYPFTYDQYDTSQNVPLRRAMKAEAGVQPDDWCLHADLDEFYTFPVHLREIIVEMEKRNGWALAAWLVDRTTRDGAMPPILAAPSIGEQFPWGCHLTDRLLNANVRRIALCRGLVRVNGSHDDTENAFYEDVPIGRKEDYVCHHFKWSQSLERRIRVRLAESGITNVYRRECNDLIQYWEAHGKLPVEDSAYGGCEMGRLNYPNGL